MDADQEVIAAWEALREHWLIPTTGNPSSRHLFANFLRLTLLDISIPVAAQNSRRAPYIFHAKAVLFLQPIICPMCIRSWSSLLQEELTHYLARRPLKEVRELDLS